MTYGHFKTNFESSKQLLNIETAMIKFDEVSGMLMAPEIAFSNIEIDPQMDIETDEPEEDPHLVIWAYNMSPFMVPTIEANKV